MNLPRLWILAVACTLPFAPAASGAESGLRNPRFATSADGRVADAWTAEPAEQFQGEARLAWVREGPSGEPVQRLTIAAPVSDGYALAQTLAAPPAGFYRMRVQMRADAPVQVALTLALGPQPGTTYGIRRLLIEPGEWREVTALALVPTLQGNLRFAVTLNDPGTLWLASASIEPVSRADFTAEERETARAIEGPELAPVDEAALLAGTEERIRANRTAPLTVRVAAAGTGAPLAGVRVRVTHRKHLFRFGSVFPLAYVPRPDETDVDRLHREAFAQLFNTGVVQIYASTYEPAPGQYLDEERHQRIGWLRANGFAVRLHPLFWSQLPPKFLASTDEVQPWMDAFLQHVSTEFLPQCAEADVFNELVHWTRFRHPLADALGGDAMVPVVVRTLQEFKRLNPQVAAVVNDYDNSPAFFHLLEKVIAAGGPVDVIGQQSHMHSGEWSPTLVWQTIERLSQLRRPVLFSEFNVQSGEPRTIPYNRDEVGWTTTPEGEQRQADYLRMIYPLIYSHPDTEGIVYWSFTDLRAWLAAPAGLLRKDGSRKPSYEALDQLINHAWRTSGEFVTDAAGEVVVPGAFEGEYEIACGETSASGVHRRGTPLVARLAVAQPARAAVRPD